MTLHKWIIAICATITFVSICEASEVIWSSNGFSYSKSQLENATRISNEHIPAFKKSDCITSVSFQYPHKPVYRRDLQEYLIDGFAWFSIVKRPEITIHSIRFQQVSSNEDLMIIELPTRCDIKSTIMREFIEEMNKYETDWANPSVNSKKISLPDTSTASRNPPLWLPE